MRIIENRNFTKEEISTLYQSVGWTYYLGRMDQLLLGFKHSQTLAIYQESHLIGLIRYITDTYTIVYIQDLLIHPDFQNKGFASLLIQRVVQKNHQVGQIVLITEDTEKTVRFYKKNTFMISQAGSIVAFYKDTRA